MAQYTLGTNPISIKIDENTIARPIMRQAPRIVANSPLNQAGKPTQNATVPSVRVLWTDNTPATSNEKYTIQVIFQVQTGGGSINGNQTTITVEPDSNGIATLQSWVLGPSAGENIVVAAANIIGVGPTPSNMVAGGAQQLSGGPLTFRATATANIVSVTVLPTPSTIAVNEIIQLKATALLEPGAPQPSWTWTTSNGTIVAVTGNSDTAIIKGLAIGNTTITATALSGDSKASGTATVEVVAVPPDPQITVSATPSTVTIVNNGSTKTTAVKIGRTNYTGNVNLLLQGLPAGVTGIFSPAATTANDSILTFQATSTAIPGTYPLTVIADGTDVTDATTDITLVVQAPPAEPLPVCVITEVTITPSLPVSLNVGQTTTVAGKAIGTNCTSQELSIRYISSNTDVVTVSTGGQITARGVGNATISAVSITDGTKSASVTIIVSELEPSPPQPTPTTTWKSCDGEIHDGNPPAGYVSATYTGAGNGICWEPVSIVGFEPDLNTALLFQYQRDSGKLPDPVTITARNPSQAINYRLTLATNDEIEVTPKIFDVPAKGTHKFTVKVTKPLLDKLADGTSDIALNIDIQQI